MIKCSGKVISDGVGIGKIRFYNTKKVDTPKVLIDDVGTEIARFNNARILAKEQLKEIYKEAVDSAGKEIAQIFEVQQLILLDEEYVNKIKEEITTNKVNAEYAVGKVSKIFEDKFMACGDTYISDRAADISDVSKRIISILSKENKTDDDFEGKVVVLEELTPSIVMNLCNASGIITKSATSTSHASIMSKNMGLAHITEIQIDEEFDGEMVILDGKEGTVYLKPDEQTLALFSEVYKEETIIKDNVNICVCANVNSVYEAQKAKDNYCDGIGLFRSEFIYMNRETEPSEEEQFEIYKQLCDIYKHKEIVIRTLDAGADKKIEYLKMDRETNPALGCRGIRFSLARKDIFKRQLRAIYRASEYGNISVMFPMISSVDEINRIKAVIAEVKKELEKENIPYKEVKFGVMIETPAAAISINSIVKMVDFISIGTNDLTQYILAADRENYRVSNLFDYNNDAVFKMIEYVINCAKGYGCRVGVCGEMASDLDVVKKLVELGVDGVSVAPCNIQKIKKYISSVG